MELLEHPVVRFTLLIVGTVCLVLFSYRVHTWLNQLCFRYVRRYCESNGIEIQRWRLGPALDETGVKTEKTEVEILTCDANDDYRVFRFVVWAFGIRSVVQRAVTAEERQNLVG